MPSIFTIKVNFVMIIGIEEENSGLGRTFFPDIKVKECSKVSLTCKMLSLGNAIKRAYYCARLIAFVTSL